jgi:hypothetical protein
MTHFKERRAAARRSLHKNEKITRLKWKKMNKMRIAQREKILYHARQSA